jgi:ABC-type branched-subunit amino acid transport system substrate-binding protein
METHGQSQQNSTMTQNYKNLFGAYLNENSNIAWRSITAVIITG